MVTFPFIWPFTIGLQIKLNARRLVLTMFTGLIEEIGTVRSADVKSGSTDFTIECRTVLEGTAVGDSIAINGCCLTATALGDNYFTATAVSETLGLTNLGTLTRGSRVNLERSVTLDKRLGGHMVQGHVDGTGRVTSVVQEGDSQRWTFSLPPHLRRYLVMKGSIAVNGVSLTIAALTPDTFSVALIPTTLDLTTFGTMAAGDMVNIEPDVIGKYVYQFMQDAHFAPLPPA